MSELLELSWKSQIVLVGGYLSYVVAYSGRRGSHGPTDILGIILCFGGIGLIFVELFESAVRIFTTNSDSLSEPSRVVDGAYWIGAVSLLVPLLCAVAWRGFLNEWIWRKIKEITGDHEDGLPSAWLTIVQQKGLEYAQLVVTLKSGVVYESYPLGDFNGYPNGPCVFGPDGGIGMYVTYITNANDQGRPVDNILDADGCRMTFIPSSEIAEVDFRRKEK